MEIADKQPLKKKPEKINRATVIVALKSVTRNDYKKQKSAGKGETMKSLADLDEECGEDVFKLPELCLKILRHFGETCEGQFHGEGIAQFEDGHMYKGMFSGGLMHGLGVLILENSLKYEGEFSCNKPSGRGTYTWMDGSSYTGEICCGQPHGTGSYKCANHGTSYIGQWYQDRRHGEGTVYYNEDKTSWYKGQWVMNKREGSGVRRYPSGNTYSGEWKNNMRHGEGTMNWLKEGQRYEGRWENGVQHGFGRHMWIIERADVSQYFQSNQYKGNFSEGQRNGEGTFYYAGGAIYTGGWKNNKRHGQGKFTATNGQVFEGEFVDDRLMRPGLAGTGTSYDTLNVLERDSSLLGPDMTLSIDPLLEEIPERKHGAERKQVVLVVMGKRKELRIIYSFYSRLGCSPSLDNTFTLTRLQFWRLLKDCNVHLHGLALTQVDHLTREEASSAEIHSPFTPMLLREFLSRLVILAFHIYKKDMMSEKHLLASCLTKLLTEDILPNATKVKGFLFRQRDVALEALKYMERCWDVFEVFCAVSTSRRDEKTVTWRRLMWMFKDLHLFDQQLTTTKFMEVSTAEYRDINGSAFLQQQITFLEFFECLLGCAEVKRQQVCDDPENQVLLRSEDQIRGNLLKVADENQQTGNVTAQDVASGEVKSQEIPQVADHTEHQYEVKDEPQSKTEAKTPQVELLVLTNRWFFEEYFLPAFNNYQSVTREMRKNQSNELHLKSIHAHNCWVCKVDILNMK